jgi:enoyl-CoA hydratase/carnithine racemase
MSRSNITLAVAIVVAAFGALICLVSVALFVTPGDGSLERLSRNVHDALDDALELVTDNIEGIFDTAEEIREDLQETPETGK